MAGRKKDGNTSAVSKESGSVPRRSHVSKSPPELQRSEALIALISFDAPEELGGPACLPVEKIRSWIHLLSDRSEMALTD